MQRIFVAVGAVLVVAALLVGRAEADPPLGEVTSTSVTCIPFNLLNPDAGVFTNVTCASGYRAVTAETEGTTPGYFCGRGPTVADYTSKCRKRCVGCNNGAVISDDINMAVAGTYNLTCISSTADAGALFAVTCGR